MGPKNEYFEHMRIANKHLEMHRICVCQYCLGRDRYDLDDLCDGPSKVTLRTLHGADHDDIFDENNPLAQVD